MEIPAIYAVFKGGEVRSAPVAFDGACISFSKDPAPLEYHADELDERMPVLVADVRGLGKRGLDDRLLTEMRFPGSDVWFLTNILDIEDVFDSLMGNIVKVLIPYHTTRNDLVMKEAFEVSENCIPVLFAAGRKVLCRGGSTKNIATAIDEMARIGFREIVVFDTDSAIGIDEWTSLGDRFSGLIPFVRNRDILQEDAGFQTVIIDH
jgi:hypothetical protein